MNYKLSPSILSADFSNLANDLSIIEEAGAHQVHIDVMDGQFVPNLSMGPKTVEACKKSTSLYLDVHLMVNTPEHLLKSFADAGADRITVHTEATVHVHRALQMIQGFGCDVGVAINPGTWINQVDAVLPVVDAVLVMTVNPGFGGQSFIEEMVPKIQLLKREIDKQSHKIDIQVDGGINEKTVMLVKKAGANDFVAGSAVFNHAGGIATGVKVLLEKIAG
jgi:ribulose-phosphate 3-epimerase